MWAYPEKFDIIVVGAGHAGCEAAHAAARMGARTLLLTMNLDTIAKMSCNPAIGGTAKGHMVREIDALGGLMGKVADRTAIQTRMLNASKGPAVWSPRCQSDKLAYQTEMRRLLEEVENLHLMQGTTSDLIVEKGRITGVETKEGVIFHASSVILSAGTFMRGLIHIGDIHYSGGRSGDAPSLGLSKALEKLELPLGRLKTGTPPRIHGKSVDFSLMEEQKSEPGIFFSYEKQPRLLREVSCHITYTTEETKKIIRENALRSPMYSGKIHSIGPRYCPSIEDKIVRFSDKERHQIFLEPEGLQTHEMYVNGISTSLPFDIQLALIRSIPCFKNVEIMRPAYAIEYDYVKSGALKTSLESKNVEGLFLAGQINGTTGYEEAASQGLIAGINAALKLQNRPPLILKRSEAYIGVMVDELISKELLEPYRMFTSRAEHRLLLRQDNADLRLTGIGYELGLIDEKRYLKFKTKKEIIEKEILRLQSSFLPFEGKSVNLAQLLRRPDIRYNDLDLPDFGEEINTQIEISLKFQGYIERQKKEAKRLESIDKILIPPNFDYNLLIGLRNEAKEKLMHHTPYNLGQASRINGVSFADITLLMVALKR